MQVKHILDARVTRRQACIVAGIGEQGAGQPGQRLAIHSRRSTRGRNSIRVAIGNLCEGSGFCHGVTGSSRLSPRNLMCVLPMCPGFFDGFDSWRGKGSHLGEERERERELLVARFCVPLPAKLVTSFSVWSQQTEWDSASDCLL
jgi:hypothetical protein